MSTLLLDRKAMATILEKIGPDVLIAQVVARLEKALHYGYPGSDMLPLREGFALPESASGFTEWMPYLDCRDSSMTIKVVSYVPSNPNDTGAPTILATISRFSTQDGGLKVLCDGVLPTALRTGAASAIASRVLASPSSRVLGIVGAGAQAVTQLHAISLALPLTDCLVYDTAPAAMSSFAERAAFTAVPVTIATPDELLAHSDVICTATSVAPGQGPVISDGALLPHVHINAIGGDYPGKTELPLSLLSRALVCPDHAEQALRDGECQQLTASQLGPDLFELSRRPDEYRSWQSTPTVFDSTGLAIEDHVALDVLLTAADTCGVGSLLDIEARPSDPRNPYAITVDIEPLSAT
ncbi:ornithine cyclodeaminase family protein [Nocardia brasiliensis]|uniref:ornithine cyclodeaminase family protein n=1 Tax=Nocardia brasiliensis TaxID=37326 RepID=UPI0024538FC5|nr:hypothetical protein [Nocardia brasiliensis]